MGMTSFISPLVMLGVVAGLAAAAPADPPKRWNWPSGVVDTGRLERVVPGAEGDPSRIELFQPRVDLRVEDSFSGVYSVRDTPHYARQAGGLYAVFPRGEYVRYAGRTIPVVPAGTVYSIGTPDITASYSTGERLKGRSALRRTDDAASVPQRLVADATSIFEPTYRSQLTRALLAARPRQ